MNNDEPVLKSKMVKKFNEIQYQTEIISNVSDKNEESFSKTSISGKSDMMDKSLDKKFTKKLTDKNKRDKLSRKYRPTIKHDKNWIMSVKEENLEQSKVSSSNEHNGGKKMFRLIDSPKIIELRLELILHPFRILLQQFPKEIEKLKTMIEDGNSLNPNRTDIVTNLNQFHIPPALNLLAKENLRNDTCNFNCQYPIYITSDGYVQSNHSINALIRSLDQHCYFYQRWVDSFFRALKLFRPPLMLIGNCEMDVQNFCIDFIENINEQVQGWFEEEVA